MAESFFLQDGYRDQQTDEAISFHYRTQTWMVRITPKNPGSAFAIPSRFRNTLEAVDYGTSASDSFVQTASKPASRVCGELVTLYFKPSTFRNMNQRPYLPAEDWSTLLSQVRVLHDAFPPFYENTDGKSAPIVINSPDFEAPNGILNSIYLAPDFEGSTFKKGPRVFGDVAMETTPIWPPQGADYRDLWSPFEGCPQMTSIAYQGDLGDNCERIFPSNLVYIDEDGYERVDAYPSGGKPRVIIDAIGPLTRFEMDSGSQFPSWDCSQLEICIRPVVAEEVVLPTRSTTVSLPIGPDLREANQLKFYSNGILNVTRGTVDGQLQPCPLVFGLKLIGVELPNSCERAINAHQIYRHQMSMGEGVSVGIKATPQIVKETFNFSLGQALENFWGNNHEDLLMPRVPSSATYLSNYASVVMDDDYIGRVSYPFYYVQINPNGSMESLKIPKISAPNLKAIDGYMERTFSYARTGEVSFTIPGGRSFSGNVRYEIPAPPENPGMVLRNFFRYGAAYSSGKSVVEETTSPPGSVQFAYGRAEDSESGIGVVAALNINGSWFTGSSTEAEYLEEMIDHNNFTTLQQYASGDIQLESSFELSISENGFYFEPFDTSSYSLVYNFQDCQFYKAEVDPTTIENVIIPVGGSTKVSGAYRYALYVSTPLHSSKVYVDNFTLQEPMQEKAGSSFQPTYTMILSYGVDEELSQQYTYKLEDIDIPSFTLGNQEDQYYLTWDTIFSGLIYGDLDGFKTAHGIDEDTSIGGSSTQPVVAGGDSMGLGVLNWRDIELPGGLWISQIPVSINPGGTGQRGFGVNLFREEIPTYPDSAPLYGDPIFIDFGKVGSNYVAEANDGSFRDAVAPSTEPLP